MNDSSGSADNEEIKNLYEIRQKAIEIRLNEFAAVPSNDYFYELIYCLLTPQSSAANAGRVIDVLRKRDFRHTEFDPVALLSDKNSYIRFHNTKARRLLEVKSAFSTIERILLDGTTGREKRMWLLENVNGLGMKESSHFLRNIGHRNLAILDRHIFRNLLRHGVIEEIPKTLSTKRYLEMEERFLRFSESLGIPIDELDLLFWSRETGVILK